MDEATMNRLYDWRVRVNDAILVYKQSKQVHTRVCALPKNRDEYSRSLHGSDTQHSCSSVIHDANKALTLGRMEASEKIVGATCDAYFDSIRGSFRAYRMQKERCLAEMGPGRVLAPFVSETSLDAARIEIMRTPLSADNTEADTSSANVSDHRPVVNGFNVDDSDVEHDQMNTSAMEVLVEGIVNSNTKFLSQWRSISKDATKLRETYLNNEEEEPCASMGKNENETKHELYLEFMDRVAASSTSTSINTPTTNDNGDSVQDESDDDESDDNSGCDDDSKYDDYDSDSDESDYDDDDYDRSDSDSDSDESDYDDDDDDDNFEVERLEGLFQLGMKHDEHAHRLFQMGVYPSAGTVLLSALRVAKAIDGIETVVREAGASCMSGITHSTLTIRNNIHANSNNLDDNSDCHCVPSETEIAEWRNRVEAIKADAMYGWFRMHHGTLSHSISATTDTIVSNRNMHSY